MDDPYLNADGESLLVPSALLYVDVLGVREMSRKNPEANLRNLKAALTTEFRDFTFKGSPWLTAAFSDMRVLASPIEADTDAATAVAGLTSQAAELQLALVQHGFFLRGAITLGDFHLHGGVIFGEALVEAVELEEDTAVHPRVVLSDAAAAAIDPACGAVAATAAAFVARDGDGRAFVDYLGWLLDDVGRDLDPDLDGHRTHVVEKLAAHRSDKRSWEKYRWVAEYHNAVVALRGEPVADFAIEPDRMRWTFDLGPHQEPD